MLAGLGIYLFLVHMLTGATARSSARRCSATVNFAAGLVMMFAVGIVLVSSLALMAPWLQILGNYPVATAGLLMAPRGIGTMADHDARRPAGRRGSTRAC